MSKVGVKGSDVYTNAGDARLTLYTQLVRGAFDPTIKAAVRDVLKHNTNEMIQDAVLLAFQTRDVRGGKGERQLFYIMMDVLPTSLAELLLPLVPEYGSWDDMFTMASKSPLFKKAVLDIASQQLSMDEKAMTVGGKLSLLGKWAPREGKAFGFLASEFARHLAGPISSEVKHSQIMATYRKRLARLNAALKTVETFECANRWDEIDPKLVPARARHIKMAAYMNEHVKKNSYHHSVPRHPHDEKRISCAEHFKAFFGAAAEGKIKISGADTLYPHELIKRAISFGGFESAADKDNLNAVWDSIVAKAPALDDSVIMADFSGSMSGTPYWVSMAMAILGSSVSQFKSFMSFDEEPRWHTFAPEEKTLFQKLDSLTRAGSIGQGYSTDFQKALDLLLATLKKTRAREPPKNLIVVTDMGFDAACGSNQSNPYTGSSYRHAVKTAAWQTHLQLAKEAFRRAGEDMWGTPWEPPRIVIWNVAAKYSTDFHAQADEPGVLTISGWSPSAFKAMCEAGPQAQTPMEGLRLLLDDTRYDPVRKVVQEWLQGGWRV
jgi:hypothetical protein